MLNCIYTSFSHLDISYISPIEEAHSTPKYPKLLELVIKFLQITSEKLIQTLWCILYYHK